MYYCEVSLIIVPSILFFFQTAFLGEYTRVSRERDDGEKTVTKPFTKCSEGFGLEDSTKDSTFTSTGFGLSVVPFSVASWEFICTSRRQKEHRHHQVPKVSFPTFSSLYSAVSLHQVCLQNLKYKFSWGPLFSWFFFGMYRRSTWGHSFIAHHQVITCNLAWSSFSIFHAPKYEETVLDFLSLCALVVLQNSKPVIISFLVFMYAL